MTQFLNYSNNIGLNIRSYRNNGYVCDTIEEFLTDVMTERECTITDPDLDSIINSLEDGEFLGKIGMKSDLAECLHADLKRISNEI